MTKASSARKARRVAPIESAPAEATPAAEVPAPAPQAPPFLLLDTDRSRVLIDWKLVRKIAKQVQAMPKDVQIPVPQPSEAMALILWLARDQLLPNED